MKHIIKTERLILRPWQMTDADAIVEGISDFETVKMLTAPYPYKKQDAIDFLERRQSDSENQFYFAITLKGSGKVIGGTNICLDKTNNTNSGGIWLNKNYQGKGYGTEAWTARAKFAFENLGLDKLYNGYFEHNKISPKMQFKIGYKIVGEQEKFCPALNKNVKEIKTVLTKDDFVCNLHLKSKNCWQQTKLVLKYTCLLKRKITFHLANERFCIGQI